VVATRKGRTGNVMSSKEGVPKRKKRGRGEGLQQTSFSDDYQGEEKGEYFLLERGRAFFS